MEITERKVRKGNVEYVVKSVFGDENIETCIEKIIDVNIEKISEELTENKIKKGA